jgi:peptidoglycan-associated lipoprotein
MPAGQCGEFIGLCVMAFGPVLDRAEVRGPRNDRSKPARDQRWSVPTIVVIMAVGAMLAGITTSALAQSGRSPTGSPGRGAVEMDRGEREARRLYEDAREDVVRGETLSGQRALELLIARFPDTTWAERARQDIVLLYSAGRTRTAVPVPAPATRSGLGIAPPVSGAQPVRNSSVPVAEATGAQHVERSAPGPARATNPAARPWQTEVARNARVVQDELIMTVGDRVFFSAGSADLGGKARAILAGQARWLAANPTAIAVIEGHADEHGGVSENNAISERRADAVRRRLIEEGVAPGRLAILALGREQRIAVCTDMACAPQNRRAVTVLSFPRQARND